MHSKSVMHRDIKAENVLLTEWSATAVVTRLHICRTCRPFSCQLSVDPGRYFSLSHQGVVCSRGFQKDDVKFHESSQDAEQIGQQNSSTFMSEHFVDCFWKELML